MIFFSLSIFVSVIIKLAELAGNEETKKKMCLKFSNTDKNSIDMHSIHMYKLSQRAPKSMLNDRKKNDKNSKITQKCNSKTRQNTFHS